jgi:opacity protein-like surface antigen
MTNRTKAALLVLLLAAVLAAPLAAAAQPVKIKVTSASAVLRLSAGPRGEVAVEKIPVGTVFEAVRKTGAWFEVRYRAEMGVLLTAYIGETDVEVIGEAPAPATVKPAPAAKAAQPKAKAEPRSTGGGGLELAIGGGLAMPGFKDWSGVYSDAWSWALLQSASETGMLSLSAKSPINLGLAATYFFNEKLGVRLRIDYLSKRTFQDGIGTYKMTWTWSVAPGGPFTQETEWPLTGDLSALPISLNGVYRFVSGPSFSAWGEAGLTIVMAKLAASGTIGYATSWTSGPQYIDYIPLPASVDASKTAFGFNAGLGAEYKIGGSLGLFLEAGYIAAGSISQGWAVPAGTYAGVNYPSAKWIFSDTLAAEVAGKLPSLEAALGFLKLAAGVRIRL